MKISIRSKLHRTAQRQRQVLSLATILFFLGLMSLSTVEISGAANNSDTNLAQNVTAGSLAIDNAPSQLNFSSGNPGSTTTVNTGNAAANRIRTNDTTGAKAGWDLTGYFNTNFYRAADANVQLPINDGGTLRMRWFPGDAVINNVTGDSGGAVAGANNNFPGINSANSLRLMNSNNSAGNNGAGAYDMFNLVFNYDISPSASSASDYKTNLRLTIA